MPYSVKGFFEINEVMVQILLMLEVLFTQDSKVEDLFCGASSGSKPSLFFSNYFFSLGFKPIQDDFHHDFARMTNEADSSVVLAELQVALFRECNNQRLRLPWYGHVERSNGAVKTAFDIQVNGKRGPGRPKMTWKQLTERDRREWKLSAIDPHDRDTQRSGVRSAMRAASQLPGRGPTVVDMAPIPAC